MKEKVKGLNELLLERRKDSHCTAICFISSSVKRGRRRGGCRQKIGQVDRQATICPVLLSYPRLPPPCPLLK